MTTHCPVCLCPYGIRFHMSPTPQLWRRACVNALSDTVFVRLCADRPAEEAASGSELCQQSLPSLDSQRVLGRSSNTIGVKEVSADAVPERAQA